MSAKILISDPVISQASLSTLKYLTINRHIAKLSLLAQNLCHPIVKFCDMIWDVKDGASQYKCFFFTKDMSTGKSKS